MNSSGVNRSSRERLAPINVSNREYLSIYIDINTIYMYNVTINGIVMLYITFTFLIIVISQEGRSSWQSSFVV